MSENELPLAQQPFYSQPGVETEILPIGPGIPLGIAQVYHSQIGLGGAYGAWGDVYDNQRLRAYVEHRIGSPLSEEDAMELASLGFVYRHHLPDLSDEEHIELELEVGKRFLEAAMNACGWQPQEIAGVLLGVSGPVGEDYVEQICKRAGIPDEALKVTVHKACDGAVGALHLALNPELSRDYPINIAESLRGKKVLVGGIEGLSRFTREARDANALQLFGNGAAVLGLIPGENMRFLVGKSAEVYDEEGLLAVKMYYPHSRRGLVDVCQVSPSHIRVAGLMHEPENGAPIAMAGMMGMVKLFVRNGVQVVTDVYRAYCQMMESLGESGRSLAVAVVHHANYKINKLKEKYLNKEGIQFPMPWLLSEFGNVSAASAMIALLRQLPQIKPGEHILIDGFGAGSYYDVLAVAIG
ncbi:MAG: 3-oxoacyl-[acyl-carrier-protein] synthase III C-terminal domain-containing protein [Anaerolineales bacterium]